MGRAAVVCGAGSFHVPRVLGEGVCAPRVSGDGSKQGARGRCVFSEFLGFAFPC